MRFFYSITFISVVSTCLAAQDASVATPALGFAFDSSLQAIRPIRGIPGAALLDDPIDLGFPIRSALIAPRQNFAVVTLDDSSVRLLRFENGGATVEALDAAMAAPDRMVLSSGGRALLLYQNSGRLQTFRGLPDRPVAQEWNIPPFTAPPSVLAISDDGQSIVTADGSVDSGAVWLLASDGGASQLPLPGSIVALSFRRNSRDLLALAANGDLYSMGDANTPYRMFHAAGTADAVAVQFSSDGARAYTADATGTLSVIDLDSGSNMRISCDCSAAGLEPLNAANLFRVTPVSDSPLMLFDASKVEARIWFVPRATTKVSAGGVQ
jgi:WD40 repeat protein